MTFDDGHTSLYEARYAIGIRIRETLHNGCVEKYMERRCLQMLDKSQS